MLDLDKIDLFADLESLDPFALDLQAPTPPKVKAKPKAASKPKTTPKHEEGDAAKGKNKWALVQIDYTTAKGKALRPWVVRPLRPLGEAFKEWLARAEQDKGWYRKEHGFLFKDHDAAKRFADQLWPFQAKSFAEQPLKIVSFSKETIVAPPEKPKKTPSSPPFGEPPPMAMNTSKKP